MAGIIVTNPHNSFLEEYRLQLLNADIAAQTGQGQIALNILAGLPADQLPLQLQAALYSIKGEAYFRLGRYDEARTSLEQSLSLHQKPEVDTASPLKIAQIRNILAGTYYQQNLHLKAFEQHRLCLQAVLDGFITETRFKLKLFNNLGNDCFCLGKLEQSLEYYTEAVGLAEFGEDDTDRATAFWGMGLVLRQLDRFEEAQVRLEQALELYTKVEAWRYVVQVRNTLGWVLISQKNYQRAEVELNQSLADATELTKSTDDQALANLNLAYLYHELGELNQAEKMAGRARTLSEGGSNRQTYALVLAQQAEIRQALGTNIDTVRELFEQAVGVLTQLHSYEYLRRVYKRYADALRQSGNLEEAFEVLSQAYSVLNKR